MANESLWIRINGITVTRFKVRREIVNGVPCGKRQMVITDPVIGNFALDDNEDLADPALSKFIIEVNEHPVKARAKLADFGWRRIFSVAELLSLLITSGATS